MIWGLAAALGFVGGYWLYEMFGKRAKAWALAMLDLPRKL